MQINDLPYTCSACTTNIGDYVTKVCAVPGMYFGNKVAFLSCPACGFVFAPGNRHEYNTQTDFGASSQPRATNRRVGTADRPGREYLMASMANEILKLAGIPPKGALIYGPGMSLDHAQLARTFPHLDIHVSDLKNFQNASNFVPLDSPETFDIVVACEVVEHFTDPKSDFGLLLAKVSKDGIAVLSTNIGNGGDLSQEDYPFIPGHTAYYSARALMFLARSFDPSLRVDFRVPQAAFAQLGPRKRYVLIYREGVAPGIADYFSRNMTAPSEAPYFRLGLVRRWYWLKRKLSALRRANQL